VPINPDDRPSDEAADANGTADAAARLTPGTPASSTRREPENSSDASEGKVELLGVLVGRTIRSAGS
jgi:hypothetical protein